MYLVIGVRGNVILNFPVDKRNLPKMFFFFQTISFFSVVEDCRSSSGIYRREEES